MRFPEFVSGGRHQEVSEIIARMSVACNLEIQEKHLFWIGAVAFIPEQHVIEPRIQMLDGAERLLRSLHHLPNILKQQNLDQLDG